MKRKLLSVLLCTILIMGILPGIAGAEGKFIFFQRKAELNPVFDEIAKIYQEETGVEMEVWGDMGDGYINTLQAKLTSGFGPTIFTVRTGVETELLTQYLSDLSDHPVTALVLNDLELVGTQGNIVGIPYGMEGYGLLVNSEILDASSVVDYASFEKALQDAQAAGKIPFEASDKGFFMVGHILNVPFAMQENPLEFIAKLNKGEVKLSETPEFVEWAKYLEAIRTYGTNPLEVSYDDQIANFANGETAMINMGNWANVLFDEYGVAFDYPMIPMPVLGNNKISVGIPNFFAINTQSSPEEQAAAADFLTWLYTSETGKKCMVEMLKLIPTVEGVDPGELDPMSETVFAATQSGESLMWTYNHWPNNIVNNYIVPATQEFFMDENITGIQYLEMLDEAWAQANQAI